MDIQTMQELKDSGFPLRTMGKPDQIIHGATQFQLDDGWYFEPTLEELIEACGELPIRIQSYWSENDLKWQADTSGNFYISPDQKAAVGTTPTEALALLWLVLQSSKKAPTSDLI